MLMHTLMCLSCTHKHILAKCTQMSKYKLTQKHTGRHLSEIEEKFHLSPLLARSSVLHTHTHTPLFLIYLNATPQQIQSEWSLCFFFLPICCFIFLLVLPLLPYNTHIYNIHTFLSQLEPNNFSLNGPTG